MSDEENADSYFSHFLTKEKNTVFIVWSCLVLGHTHNHFMVLWILSGAIRVSRYQKKHSPTHTYRGHQSSLICFIHVAEKKLRM